MIKDVKGIMASEILKAHQVIWFLGKGLENSLWKTGFAYVGRDYHRVACYSDQHEVLII